jgi:hypothetical protein
MEIVPHRKRGRPRVQEPRSSVSTWIPSQAHDRLASIARSNDVSVSAVVRRVVFLFLKDDRSGGFGA